MWGSFFFPHKVTVRRLLGSGGMGSSWGSAEVLDAEVLDRQDLVRDRDGAEVVSSTRVTVPLAAEVPVGSMVTVWLGTAAERTAEVLQVARDENDPPLPSHLVLSLT